MNNSRPASHPAATWPYLASGQSLPQNTLIEQLLKNNSILPGDRHDVAEIHRWQLHVIAMLFAHHPHYAAIFAAFSAE